LIPQSVADSEVQGAGVDIQLDEKKETCLVCALEACAGR
jgi:hypothetical protein